MKPKAEDIRRIECGKGDLEITMPVGEVFYYQFHRHGSVGEDAEFDIGDTDIITHERTHTEYLHPEKMKPGWTGGDAERGKWFFRAVKAGRTTLKIRILFRFEVESECTFNVVVE
ncbi:MAG: hypothetical protein RTU92_08430 [Candidatus Thorarchaeota archaeon]